MDLLKLIYAASSPANLTPSFQKNPAHLSGRWVSVEEQVFELPPVI